MSLLFFRTKKTKINFFFFYFYNESVNQKHCFCCLFIFKKCLKLIEITTIIQFIKNSKFILL